MYDIEGKLKRRAMLERLEGLGRAAEATSNAVVPDLPPAPVPAAGPRPRHRHRHRTEPVAEPTAHTEPTPHTEPTAHTEPTPHTEPSLREAPSPLHDNLSLRYKSIDALSAAPGAGRYDPHQQVEPAPPAIDDAQVVNGVEPGGAALTENAVDLASSAATIADLLRHGAGRLFFEAPRPPAGR
jgi:hypothetical protein